MLFDYDTSKSIDCEVLQWNPVDKTEEAEDVMKNLHGAFELGYCHGTLLVQKLHEMGSVQVIPKDGPLMYVNLRDDVPEGLNAVMSRAMIDSSVSAGEARVRINDVEYSIFSRDMVQR
jgi:hypothetical protein